jgi:chemotaxis protein MotB
MSEQTIIIRKKIVKGHTAHHGGSWKVAYADFVTAMMAFFMVMWLVGLSQDVRDRIQGYFNDPLGIAQTEPRSMTMITMEGLPQPKPGEAREPGDNAFRNEQKQMQKLQKKVERVVREDASFLQFLRGIRISQTGDGLLIEFAETRGAVFFESGSAVIRPEAKKLVEKIASILANDGHTLVVQGHTDSQPFAGARNGNWGLSTERALSLQEALMDGGVKDEQFAEVSGFASRRLLDPADPTGFSNRRVTILIPRKYREGDATPEPADSLRQAIQRGTEPQAVVIKPDPPDLIR